MKVKSLLLMAVLALSLSACGWWGNDETATQTSDMAGDDKSIVESIGDVFSPITRCEYIDEDGTKSVMHIKGDEIYVEADQATATAEDLDMEGFLTGDKMYMWSKTTREGLVFNLATMNEEDAVTMKETVIRSTKDLVKLLETEGVNCAKSSLDAGTFSVPSDVKFMSFEEMFQGWVDESAVTE